MKPFHYHQPTSLKELFSFLEEYGSDARILAGGTDLIVQMRRGAPEPGHIVSLKSVPGLDSIEYDKKQGLSIGALVTMAQLERSELIRTLYPHLHHAASILGGTQTRNLATIGGNLCNASPAAETAPSLLVSEAEVETAGPRGVRRLPLGEFFRGPGSTCLSPTQILKRILIPRPVSGAHSLYVKHSPRRLMDIAVVGIAVLLVADAGIYTDARIGLGAVAPTPIRAAKAENLLRGNRITVELATDAARMAADECSPISDVRASGEYRRSMVQVLTKRVILALLSQEVKSV